MVYKATRVVRKSEKNIFPTVEGFLLQAIVLQAQVDAAMETVVNQAVMWMHFFLLLVSPAALCWAK